MVEVDLVRPLLEMKFDQLLDPQWGRFACVDLYC